MSISLPAARADRPVVLLSGDERLTLQALVYLLDRGGFRVLAVPGLAEAARLCPLFARALDGCVVDAEPGGRGLCALLAALKRYAPAVTPILLHDPHDSSHGDRPGPVRFAKPVDPERLLALCHDTLPHPAARGDPEPETRPPRKPPP